jgi:FKBP-type peptidyl-prolyl cis-trans isomerase 2
MADTISTNKFVELTYRIVDKSNGEVIEQVEDPLGYVQGDNTLLFNQVTKELEGRSVGDEVEILLKAEEAFGPKIQELILLMTSIMFHLSIDILVRRLRCKMIRVEPKTLLSLISKMESLLLMEIIH